MPKDIINTTPNTNRARRENDRIPEFEDDYVLEGCGLSVDADNELAVTHGELTVTHGDQVYHVAVDARTGSDTITVPDNSSLGVYYDLEPNDVVLQASAPASPSLQMGTVDSGAGTTTEVNREPARRARSLSTADLDNKIGKSQIQAAFDGLVCPIADGLGMTDAVDPSTTSTPVQDAIDKLPANYPDGGGNVLLPGGSVTETPPIEWPSNVGIWGLGPRASFIDIEGVAGENAVEFVGSALRGGGFTIRGPGFETKMGVTFKAKSNVSHNRFTTLHVEDWYGTHVLEDGDGGSNPIWQTEIGTLWCQGVDLTDSNGDPSAAYSTGTNRSARNRINKFHVVGDDSGSGTDSKCIDLTGTELHVGSLSTDNTIGGPARAIASVNGSKLRIEYLKHEPSGSNTAPFDLVRLDAADYTAQVHIGRVEILADAENGNLPEWTYYAGTGTYPGRDVLGPTTRDQPTQGAFKNDGDPENPVYIFEPSSNVLNGAGTLTSQIVCLGDLTQISS